MDEMTLIFMNKYLIEVNHFKHEIIWQNMQEKISDKPRYSPMDGVPSERIFRYGLQHTTDIIKM
jgi:hypothetical protein